MTRPPLICALLALAVGCSKKPEGAGTARGPAVPVPVEVAAVAARDMPLDLRAIGNVESIRSVGIKAQVGGELIEVNFEEGREVKRGDLLFTIQPKLYTVQLAQAEANAARDRATAENARRDAERSKELGSRGAISKEELDQIVSTAEAAEATVKADEALVEIARVRLGYATIEAPIDGRTGALEVHVGNLIKDNADTPMVTIRQMAPIYVSFALPEQHLAEIRQGQSRASLTVIALDPKSNRPLADGALTFIDNTVDSTTGMVTLKATFANEDRALWPGAFVDVLLRLRTDAGVAVAPASAITIGQQGPQMFVVNQDGSVDLRPVIPGRTVGQDVIIETGVTAGETVIVNGHSRLVPGAKVIVHSPERPHASDQPASEKKRGGA